MANEFSIELKGLDGALEMLQKLPPEVVSKRGGPVRAALRKAGSILRKQAVANINVVTRNATKEQSESTGFLAKNISVRRGKQTDSNGERYIVGPRKRTYSKAGTRVSTLQTASFLEYGTAKQPAEPWLRPALASKGQEAIKAFEQDLLKSIDNIAEKYLK